MDPGFGPDRRHDLGLQEGEPLSSLRRPRPYPRGRGEILDRVKRTKVGETGYVYILDADGRNVASQNGKRDGELIIDAKDAAGNPFIRNVLGKAKALKPEEIAEESYPWKNEGDATSCVKLVRIGYIASLS